MEFEHKPVMLSECLEGLNINPDGIYMDCTVGGAGHSVEIVKKLKNGTLLCLDKDEVALKVAGERLEKFGEKVKFFSCDFKDFEQAKKHYNIEAFDGILIDLGVSSYQIDTPERGFSYMHDGALDMRMNREQDLTAYEIINEWSQPELVRIFREYGEEQFASNIAKHIVAERAKSPVKTTFELVKIIEQSIPAKIRFKGGHCAKKVFQALRIAVNGELDGLYETLISMAKSLKPRGRLAVLTFHSLEDRIVKRAFTLLATDCICPPKAPVCICNHHREVVWVNKKPLTAGEAEQAENTRSHSAKLRVVERV